MGAFFQELFKAGIYKRSQGRIVRQVTFAVLAVTFGLGMLRLYQTLHDIWGDSYYGLAYSLPGILLLLGWWMSFRVVNWASFADFLIAVEAELNKVSWPTRSELFRSSLVVLVSIVFLAIVLFSFDIIWQGIFRFLKIL